MVESSSLSCRSIRRNDYASDTISSGSALTQRALNIYGFLIVESIVIF